MICMLHPNLGDQVIGDYSESGIRLDVTYDFGAT
jgi:hypothetical protein